MARYSVEQLQKNIMVDSALEPQGQANNDKSENRKKCENLNTLMLAKSEIHRQAIIFHPRCKQWSCPACAEINAAKWGAFARQTSAYISDHLYFVTITARGKTKSLEESMVAFTESWKRLLARVQYYNSLVEWAGTHGNPKRFIYLAIPEQTKKGIMHMHIICNQWLFLRLSKLVPERRKKRLVVLRWKDIAMETGLGYQAKVEPINTNKLFCYVTKYLSKDLGKVDWPKGFRRVRLSQSWPRLENDTIGDWSFHQLDPKALEWNNQIEMSLIAQGYTINYADHLESWSIIDQLEDIFTDFD